MLYCLEVLDCVTWMEKKKMEVTYSIVMEMLTLPVQEHQSTSF